MKRILFFVLLCAICSIGNAQKIISDDVDSDGLRVIMCEEFNVSPTFKLGLTSVKHQYMHGFTLMVYTFRASDFAIKKDMALLLKTIDDEVITLNSSHNMYAQHYMAQSDEGNAYPGYFSLALYNVDKETLLKLCKGIKKIRQETTDGLVDDVIDDDEAVVVGSMLKKEYDLMEEAYKTPKDIYSDF